MQKRLLRTFSYRGSDRARLRQRLLMGHKQAADLDREASIMRDRTSDLHLENFIRPIAF